MEQLRILEKICDNIFDSLESDTAIYIFFNSVNAAIYDTWYDKGTELEKNLAKRLVSLWKPELEAGIYAYSNNQGIGSALAHIWEKKYEFRHWN